MNPIKSTVYISTSLLFLLVSTSCHTHRKSLAIAHEIGIDSTEMRISLYNLMAVSSVNSSFKLREWSISGGDTIKVTELEYNCSRTDTAREQKEEFSEFALQSHEIDSVVQVSTTEPKTQQRANKLGFWACLKMFCFSVLCVLIVLGIIKVRSYTNEYK